MLSTITKYVSTASKSKVVNKLNRVSVYYSVFTIINNAKAFSYVFEQFSRL